MSFTDDCEKVTMSNFYGANQIADEEDITEPSGVDNQNVIFTEGGCATRPGFGPAFNPDLAVRILYNWIQQAYNRLLYLNASNQLVSRNLATSAEDTLLTGVSASGMTFAQAGYRVYMSFFDSTGNATGNAKVWDGMFTSGVANIDDVFAPPIQTSALSGGTAWGTFSEPNPGSVDAGTHFYALVTVTRNGFQMVGPYNSGVFTPESFVSAGGKTVGISVSPATNWPVQFTSIQIAMTTAQNPNRWFLVPSTLGGGPFGIAGSIPANFEINIDDDTLTSVTTEITNTLFNQFTGNLFVHSVLGYNNRNVYLARILAPDGLSSVTGVFVSDPYQPQSVVPATNQLSLPEFRDGVCQFVLGGELFVSGPSWTYAWRDNNNSPVFWPAPRLVSGEKGTPFIRGVTVNQPTGWAWVADHSGLYCFTGNNFTAVPASYLQRPTWDRINFAADANALSLEEDVNHRLIVVRAPLDGATFATHLIVWDYTEGVVPGKIKYCGLWPIAQFPNLGDIEIVQASPTKIKELWVSREDGAGKVLRLKSIEAGDATDSAPGPLYDDDGNGIDSYYKALTVNTAAEGPSQQVGLSLRVRGLGQLNLTAYSFDNDQAVPMAPILSSEMSLTPGQRFYRLVDMQSEIAMYKWNNGGAAGAFFNVAAITSYFTPWMTAR